MALHLVTAEDPLDMPGGRQILLAFPFAAYTTDANGRITAFNQPAAKLWGREPHLGEEFWCGSHKLYWPSGQPMAHEECPMAQTVKTGNAVRGMEALLERPDGIRIPFAPYPTALKDSQGNVTGGVNILIDLTDRLEAAKSQFAAIVESSDDAIISKDLNGIIRSWNKGAERTFGWTADEVLGQHVSILIPADRLDEEPGIIERIRRGEHIEHYETIRKRKDGSLLNISLSVSPVKDAGGQVVGAAKISRDITDKKLADELHSHFAAIVESSDDAIISKGLDGMIRSWNKSAERIFGWTAEEAVGRHISLLIPEDRINEEPGIIERIRRGERVDHFETIRQHKNGTLVSLSLTISPIKNAAGHVVGASKIARDITEKKRADEARELLLHEIKHRVKNTLGTVQAIATQTFREGPRAERDAFNGRLRALSNAHDLLTQQDWDRVSTRSIIERGAAPFQENRQARFSLSGDDVILSANQALLLAMALHELATNAAKYGALSNETGQVALTWHVRRDHDGRHFCLEWLETGGPVVDAPTRKGFGSTLIERALQQEQGRSCFDFRPEGVVCSLEIKL